MPCLGAYGTTVGTNPRPSEMISGFGWGGPRRVTNPLGFASGRPGGFIGGGVNRGPRLRGMETTDAAAVSSTLSSIRHCCLSLYVLIPNLLWRGGPPQSFWTESFSLSLLSLWLQTSALSHFHFNLFPSQSGHVTSLFPFCPLCTGLTIWSSLSSS